MSYSPSCIRSIQHISITFAGAHTATATLSPAVDPTKAILIPQGNLASDSSSGTINGSGWATAVITNGTTVTATLGSGALGSSAFIYNAVVVEFHPRFVKSQGSGVITIASGSSNGTATIAAVNRNKTILTMTGFGLPTASYRFAGDLGDNVNTQLTPRVKLETDNVTITAYWTTDPGGSRTVSYAWIELK